MASANAPSLKGAHAQRGLCEPWESTTLIRTLPKRAKRQHSDTRENPSLCFQQFTPTPRKHGLASALHVLPCSVSYRIQPENTFFLLSDQSVSPGLLGTAPLAR